MEFPKEIIIRFEVNAKGTTVTAMDGGELIRCKDCRFYFKSDEKCQLIVTRLHFYAIDKRWTEDSFCSWAERKEE